MGISGFRHTCEHMRRHARRLNPLACAFLTSPDSISFRRHPCARLRIPNTGGATGLLSASVPPNRAPASVRRRRRNRYPAPPTPYASGAVHRDVHYRHDRAIWKSSPTIESGSAKMGVTHPPTPYASGAVHRDVHYRHDRAIWKSSPTIESGSAKMGVTAPSTIQPSPVLGHFVRPRVGVGLQPVEAPRQLWRIDNTVPEKSIQHSVDENRRRRSVPARRSSYRNLCRTTAGRRRSAPDRPGSSHPRRRDVSCINNLSRP